MEHEHMIEKILGDLAIVIVQYVYRYSEG